MGSGGFRHGEPRSETERQHRLGLPVDRGGSPHGKDMVSALAISSSAVPVAAIFVSVPVVAQVAAAPVAAVFVSVPVAAQVLAVPLVPVFVSVAVAAQVAVVPLAAIFVSVPVAAQVPLVVSVSSCFPS